MAERSPYDRAELSLAAMRFSNSSTSGSGGGMVRVFLRKESGEGRRRGVREPAGWRFLRRAALRPAARDRSWGCVGAVRPPANVRVGLGPFGQSPGRLSGTPSGTRDGGV
jgi:hypothetical protein